MRGEDERDDWSAVGGWGQAALQVGLWAIEEWQKGNSYPSVLSFLFLFFPQLIFFPNPHLLLHFLSLSLPPPFSGCPPQRCILGSRPRLSKVIFCELCRETPADGRWTSRLLNRASPSAVVVFFFLSLSGMPSVMHSCWYNTADDNNIRHRV